MNYIILLTMWYLITLTLYPTICFCSVLGNKTKGVMRLLATNETTLFTRAGQHFVVRMYMLSKSTVQVSAHGSLSF